MGEKGYLIISDAKGRMVSDPKGNKGRLLDLSGITTSDLASDPGIRKRATVYGVDSFWMHQEAEGYSIIAVMPVEEAFFSRNLSVYVISFMEVIVFASLFIQIYFLIKQIVIGNIQKVNKSLAEITGGNLNVCVNVRGNEEFASLSDDINTTVEVLKHYIAEAAARIDKELEFAKAIQHSVLPSVFPPFPHRKDFSIYAMMSTAKEVGGDFYDFYLLGEHTLVFLIADVSGKGIPAAMFMMNAKTVIKNYAEAGLPVEEVFTRANTRLCEGNDAEMFVTAWMGMLDLLTGVVSYADAGHNPPLVKKASGEYIYLRDRPNLVLAGMDGVKYKRHELQISPGDEILLYTDGVTEATDSHNELYDESRLLSCVNKCIYLDRKSLIDAIKVDVDAFVGDAPQFDDITMLALKYNGEEV